MFKGFVADQPAAGEWWPAVGASSVQPQLRGTHSNPSRMSAFDPKQTFEKAKARGRSIPSCPQRRIAAAGATSNPGSYRKMLSLVRKAVGMPKP